ncbi:MAG: phosphate ABC transporter substrate-binding protein PstS [Calditrichaeota bacterium]|nr:phosphate ABC transporter substrate-binding protein PstS [Calditrichota bacterium]
MSKTLTTLLTALLLLSVIIPTGLQAADIIHGAGATFPYPLYSQWAYKYNQITGLKMNYQSIGSGGGIRQIKAGTVDFGASDAPMKHEELEEFGLMQFPMVIGGVVPVVNIKGIAEGQLHLDSETLANIFLGKIDKWNDPAIAALNPGLDLPSRSITVVHRADGSGTTWIYTKYLAAVSEDWNSSVGAGKAVSWPVGVGGKGNEGVASYVQRIKGSIGYVEYAYALQNKLSYILLKNRDGQYTAPTMDSFMAAAEGADWENAPGFYIVLVDQPGTKTWPITGASFILVYKEQVEVASIKSTLDFFDWCYKHGKDIAANLDYVPIPDNVVGIVQSAWQKNIKSNGEPIWK